MKRVKSLIFALLIALFASCGTQKETGAVVARYLPPQTHKPVIVLDAGHGGDDTGAIAHGITEKNSALTATLLAKKHLNTLGYRVVLTRDRDRHVPLRHRSLIANKHKNGVFVSIHLNSAPSKEAQGIEVFYCDNHHAKRVRHSHSLAGAILDNLIHKTSAKSRGVKKGRFHVIRETKIPSVLVEAGFITNSEESTKLKCSNYLDTLALGIAHGVDQFISSSL